MAGRPSLFLPLPAAVLTGSFMSNETKKSPVETADDLCRQADAEPDFAKLLELASKLQRFIEARWKRKRVRGLERMSIH
jgi:hypothetical protein